MAPLLATWRVGSRTNSTQCGTSRGFNHQTRSGDWKLLLNSFAGNDQADGLGKQTLAILAGRLPLTGSRRLLQRRQIVEPQLELFRAAGALAAERPVPPDATPQTRFLAILGRG